MNLTTVAVWCLVLSIARGVECFLGSVECCSLGLLDFRLLHLLSQLRFIALERVHLHFVHTKDGIEGGGEGAYVWIFAMDIVS